MKLVKSKKIKGDKYNVEKEPLITNDINFKIYKFNNRPKPTDPRQIHISGCFSEFGCESVGVMYNIPIVLQRNPGLYHIAVGWYGREYLYRHLVDEFWEINEEAMWLRDYARAFHHSSKNLRLLEQKLNKMGRYLNCEHMGRIAVSNKCGDCKHVWGNDKYVHECVVCHSKNIEYRSLFGDVPYWQERALDVPKPSEEMQAKAREYLGERPVGIFGRGRKTYGRNLTPEFYKDLIANLEEKGYTPIWLGEKQSTQPCPVDHIVDFSRMPESRDLELTLAIICQLEFTVQFWTASTRLASMMGTPYLLIESPDQIWGSGQEGYRRNLVDRGGPAKLAASHYLNFLENPKEGLKLVMECIEQMENKDYGDVIGLVEDRACVEGMRNDNHIRIGG